MLKLEATVCLNVKVRKQGILINALSKMMYTQRNENCVRAFGRLVGFQWTLGLPLTAPYVRLDFWERNRSEWYKETHIYTAIYCLVYKLFEHIFGVYNFWGVKESNYIPSMHTLKRHNIILTSYKQFLWYYKKLKEQPLSGIRISNYRWQLQFWLFMTGINY